MKLLYSHLAFWTLPIPEEEFYIEKGNYYLYLELGLEDRAKKSFRKAKKTSPDGVTDLMVGYRYAQLGEHDKAVEAYRQAMEKPGGDRGRVGLAIEEYESGNLENSEAVIRQIRASGKLGTSESDTLDLLEAQIEVTRRARVDRSSTRNVHNR